MKQIFPILTKDTSKEFYTSLEKFVDDVSNAVIGLRKAIEHYCNGEVNAAKESVKKVIEFEKNADTTRREMSKILYTGVLIPFGREDKYELIESIDDVADKAEIIVRLATLRRPEIPKKIKEDLKDLAYLVESSVLQLKTAVSFLNSDLNKAIEEASKVELQREKVRDLEFKILGSLINQRKEIPIKILLLRELVSLTGRVADDAEEAADRVIALAVKYKT